MTANHKIWGPWIRHDGSGMPVPSGTMVDARSEQPRPRALNGIACRQGIAGVDLVNSWHWTPETRLNLKWLPIDYYRIKRPKGIDVLSRALAETPELEDA